MLAEDERVWGAGELLAAEVDLGADPRTQPMALAGVEVRLKPVLLTPPLMLVEVERS